MSEIKLSEINTRAENDLDKNETKEKTAKILETKKPTRV